MLAVVSILALPLTEDQKVTAFFGISPLVILGWVAEVIRTGEFGPLHGKGCRFSRAQTPVRFWATIAFCLLLALGIWLFVGYRAL